MSDIKICLFYILFIFYSHPQDQVISDVSNWKMPEIKCIMVLGWGINLTWLILARAFFFSNFSLNPSYCLTLKQFRKKKKQHYFLSRSTAASGQTWLFFMCKKLTGSRLLRQTGDHPQPWECEHSVRISVLRGQKLSPTLPVTSKRLSQAACNPNQTTSDFRPSLGNLVIFLPLSDGKWQVEKKEE